LHYAAYQWFKHIEEFNTEKNIKNKPLELSKNGLNLAKNDALNGQNKLWCAIARKVRISILKH
jgi:hypothetical protein